MIKVEVVKKVDCPVSAGKIKNAVSEIFKENGIISDALASVTFVRADEMRKLSREYIGEEREVVRGHPVLSFVTSEIEGPFSFPPDGKIHIGEIVINWDWVLSEAKERNRLIDEVAVELAEHGALHLLGIHHD